MTLPLFTRASVYGLAIHEGHVLLTQLAPFCTRGGSWSLPGGGIDHGEQPLEALMRELYEETGLRPTATTLLEARTYSETSSRGPYLAVQIVYTVEMQGTPSVQEVGGSTADVRWVPLDALPTLHLVPLVTQVLGL